MAIIGLTVTKEGQAIQRLSVSTKLAVGLPPDVKAGRKAPMKLDFIIFLRKTNDGSGLNSTWEIDPVLTKHYGKDPREVEIILLSDDIEEVFQSRLAWFTASQLKCWGDGENATRRTAEHPDGEPWAPEQSLCGRECPDYQKGDCKPSGDLRFMLADFPRLGSVARLHTSSHRSIQQIHSALQQLQIVTGGRLAGIKASLVVRQEKTSYMGDDNKRHSTIIPALSLEVQAPGMKSLIAGMVSTAALFEQTKKLLGSGHVQVLEDDNETAPEIAKEFYSILDAEDDRPLPKRRNAEEKSTVSAERMQETTPKCSECNAINGHLPSCSHRKAKAEASNQSADAQSERRTDPGVKGKHKPEAVDSKQADSARAENDTMTVDVKAIEPKLRGLGPKQLKENAAATASGDALPHEQQAYFRVVFADDTVADCYDKPLFQAITKAQKKKCTFVVKRSSKGFITITDIVSIGGVKFARDPETKESIPADILAATQKHEARIDQNSNAAPKLTEPTASDPVGAVETFPCQGRMVEFRRTNPKTGELLMTRSDNPQPFVTFKIYGLPDDVTSDPNSQFFCLKPELFAGLASSEEEDIAFFYTKYKTGDVIRQVLEKTVRPSALKKDSKQTANTATLFQ